MCVFLERAHKRQSVLKKNVGLSEKMKRSQDQVALQPPSAGTAAGTTPAGAPSNYPLTPAGNATAGVTISMPMVGAASYDSGRVRRKKNL